MKKIKHDYIYTSISQRENAQIVYHLRGNPLYSNQIVSTPGGRAPLKNGLSCEDNKGRYPIRGARI